MFGRFFSATRNPAVYQMTTRSIVSAVNLLRQKSMASTWSGVKIYKFLNRVNNGHVTQDDIYETPLPVFHQKGSRHHNNENTIIHLISLRGHVQAYKDFLQRCEHANKKCEIPKALVIGNAFGCTPFYYMASCGYKEFLTRTHRMFGETIKQTVIAKQHLASDSQYDVTSSNYPGVESLSTELKLRLAQLGIVNKKIDDPLLNAINKPTTFKVTPLLTSLYNRHTNTAMHLVRGFYADLFIKNEVADSVLLAALRKGNSNFCTFILDYCRFTWEKALAEIKDPSLEIDDQSKKNIFCNLKLQLESLLLYKDHDGLNACHIAANYRDTTSFNGIIKFAKQLDAHVTDSCYQDESIVQRLLLCKAGDQHFGRTPLHMAAQAGSRAIVDTILAETEIANQLVVTTTMAGRIPVDLCSNKINNPMIKKRSPWLHKNYRNIKKKLVGVYRDGLSDHEKQARRNAILRKINENIHDKTKVLDIVLAIDERLFIGAGKNNFIYRLGTLCKLSLDSVHLKRAIYASRIGEETELLTLANKMYNIKETDAHGFSILHLAVRHGYSKLVYNLLQQGIGANFRAEMHTLSSTVREYAQKNVGLPLAVTPLFEAAFFMQIQALDILFESDVDILSLDANRSWNALPLLIWEGGSKTVLKMLRKLEEKDTSALDFIIQKRNRLNHTLLYISICTLHYYTKLDGTLNIDKCQYIKDLVDLVKYLLRNNADPNVHTNTVLVEDIPLPPSNPKGRNFESCNMPIHIAALISEDPKISNPKKIVGVEIGRLLIKHGSTVFMKDSTGLTPLHIAARAGNKEFVRFLITIRADPFVTSYNGKYAIEMAAGQNADAIKEILLRAMNTKNPLYQWNNDYYQSTHERSCTGRQK